jgi:Copper type II ascorbate-dependent monooxygenase, N-terminal domain/Copper type II ascorbate-dependent monooxygenase, C-terminal domain
MRQTKSLAFLLIPALTAIACGNNESQPSGAGSGGTSSSSSSSGAGGAGGAGAMARGLPCSVDSILQANCQKCHSETPQFGAPMPLVTHENLTATALSDPERKVYQVLTERIHSDLIPMPPPPNARLSAEDTKVLDDWIAASAPKSTDVCTSGTGSTPGAPSCTPDIHVVPKLGFTMPKDQTDVYMCYGIDVTVTEKRHITAFVPKIDNTKIVHHIVLFQTDTAQPAGPAACNSSNGRIVSVWAPGVNGFELPPEAGLPLEGTTHYLLQVHYNNLQRLEGEADASGIDLCSTTSLRPNDADVLALGTFNINIPAHASLEKTCDLNVPVGTQDLHIVGAMPHMHKLGTAISTVNFPGGTGAGVDLATREKWDFSTQYWSPLTQIVKAGDKVRTRCAWKNPGDVDVKFGENTENEMCFSFTMYYPKITASNWNWTYPAFLSQCTDIVTPGG